jgi:N-methylhydantoinase B
MRVSLLTERTRVAPQGLLGGLPGQLGSIRRNGVPIAETKGIVELAKGDVLEVTLPGGGGIESPTHRDRDLVQLDLRSGLVSGLAAHAAYGL